ncbi:MAG: hypothetical protein QXU32_11080 [Nitrososphaerales archaeon]
MVDSRCGKQQDSRTSRSMPTLERPATNIEKVLMDFLSLGSEHDDALRSNGTEVLTRFAYCQALLYKAWVDASDEIADKLTKSTNKNKNPKDLTALYIETFETRFTELFRTPEFMSNLSRLLDSLMEQMKANNVMLETFQDNLTILKNLKTDKTNDLITNG